MGKPINVGLIDYAGCNGTTSGVSALPGNGAVVYAGKGFTVTGGIRKALIERCNHRKAGHKKHERYTIAEPDQPG